MTYKSLEALKWAHRRAEFHSTEHETLLGLVRDAISKGNRVRGNMKIMKNISKTILGFAEDIKMFYYPKPAEDQERTVVGIDGSFQVVGGTAGLWYAPISAAQIVMNQENLKKPLITIQAHIEEIDENKTPNIYGVAEEKMLEEETDMIMSWGCRNIPSLVMIDGPIIDPPRGGSSTYIQKRAKAILQVMIKSHLVGCVKRPRDRFLIEYLVSEGLEDSLLKKFPSDQFLIAYLFQLLRSNGKKGTLCTKCFPPPESHAIKKYQKNGIEFSCLFFQLDSSSRPIRLDLAGIQSEDEAENTVSSIISWTYPRQHIPLPVMLAHEKCRIRKGCAEVIFDEIMTRKRSSSMFDAIVDELLW